jgi:hypothetical protein
MAGSDTQLMFKLSGTLPNGEAIRNQICTTATVIRIYVLGAVVHQLERIWV